MKKSELKHLLNLKNEGIRILNENNYTVGTTEIHACRNMNSSMDSAQESLSFRAV